MNQTDIRDYIGSVQTREIPHPAQTAIDTEARTAAIAFSSETPVERWFGFEILDHAPGSVRLDRLRATGPALLDHDPASLIGAISESRIDADRKGRATIRFGKSGKASEVFADVVDGIRRSISVGYRVYAMALESKTNGIETYRVTDWEPLEISLVAIPADGSAGIGRSLIFKKIEETQMEKDVATDTNPTGGDGDRHAAVATTTPVTARAAATPEIPEAAQIRAVGKHFRMAEAAEDHIMLGGTLADFRAFIRTQRPDPVPVVPRIEMRIPHAGTLRAFSPDLYAGGRREAEEQAYRAGQWARGVIFGDLEAIRWCRDHDVLYAAASADMRMTRVLTGLAGGQSVLVPNEMVLPIIALREQYGVARRRCQIHPMTSDTASIPRRTSGATAYFVGREGAPTAADPAFDNVNLTARNVAAETRISNDYADDSVINLADFLAQEHALAFATKEDGCLFNGDGTSTYGGIVGFTVLLNGASGMAGSVDVATINTFAEVTATHLEGVVGLLPDIAGIRPAWYCSKRAEALMFGRLRGAGGGNSKGDLAAGTPKTWDGDEIVLTQVMVHGTSATDYDEVVMALYGDMSMAAVLGDRRGMTMLTDPYSLSSNQQTKIISSERFDIVCHGFGDATNPGPMVALVGEAS